MTRRRIVMKQLAVIILPLLLAVLILPIGNGLRTNAAEIKGTISIACRDEDGKELVGVTWNLYYIGTRDADGNLILNESLEDSGIRTKALPIDLAVSLQHYAQIHLTPDYTGKTNTNGKLLFTDVPEGVYLACGEEFIDENRKYFPSPTLFDVMESETNPSLQWNLQPKFTVYSFRDSQVTYIVAKDWVNDGDAMQDRPESITVSLYRNGKFYQNIELNAENQWTYSWRGSINDCFQVLETEIPPNYLVTYGDNFEELSYLISNRHEEIVTTTQTQQTTTETISTTQSTAATTTNRTDGTTATTTTDTNIPYTGQLWWPVPCMGIGGILLIGIGKRMRHKEE